MSSSRWTRRKHAVLFGAIKALAPGTSDRRQTPSAIDLSVVHGYDRDAISQQQTLRQLEQMCPLFLGPSRNTDDEPGRKFYEQLRAMVPAAD
jgi:hypothetical protein